MNALYVAHVWGTWYSNNVNALWTQISTTPCGKWYVVNLELCKQGPSKGQVHARSHHPDAGMVRKPVTWHSGMTILLQGKLVHHDISSPLLHNPWSHCAPFVFIMPTSIQPRFEIKVESLYEIFGLLEIAQLFRGEAGRGFVLDTWSFFARQPWNSGTDSGSGTC